MYRIFPSQTSRIYADVAPPEVSTYLSGELRETETDRLIEAFRVRVDLRSGLFHVPYDRSLPDASGSV